MQLIKREVSGAGVHEITDILEQEVQLANEAHLALPERVLVCWDAWAFCVAEVGALADDRLTGMMPYDLTGRTALDLKRAHTFADLWQARATLSVALHILARAERAMPGALLAHLPGSLELVEATTTANTLKALLDGQLSACAPLLDDASWAARLLERAG